MHYRSGGGRGGGTVKKKRRPVASDYQLGRHSRSIRSTEEARRLINANENAENPSKIDHSVRK